jgi:hypothetical protein
MWTGNSFSHTKPRWKSEGFESVFLRKVLGSKRRKEEEAENIT